MEYGTIKNGVINLEYNGEGFLYKNRNKFVKKEGICYVPENGVDDDDSAYTVETSDTYTYDDLLKLATEFVKRNAVTTATVEEVTKSLFDSLEWQSPSTIIDQWENYGSFEE